jgi:Fuc2NAc and GlcNAc transferase
VKLTVLASLVAALIGSVFATGAMRRFAFARGMLDVPNRRSSHKVVTPRGGGAAIVLVTSLACAALVVLDDLRASVFGAVVVGGAVVAIVGFFDDRNSVSPRVRLLVHFAAAIWADALLGGLPALPIGSHLVQLGWVGHVLAVLSIVWTLNLFNFMDGIDGIAAAEAVFISLAGAVLGLVVGHWQAVAPVALVFAAACGGFLCWNWPPAKIFMGDVGSGYLGYVIAVAALAAAREDPVAAWVWLILGAAFFIDSTLTLVRRAARGDRIYVAHRSHAYQWLARRYSSHLKVTLGTVLLNLLWLLPCSIVAARHPERAAAVTLIACVPVFLLAWVAGAGRRETSSD